MVKQAIMMKLNSEKDLLNKARKSIETVLSDVPFITLLETKADLRVDDQQIDLVVNARVSGKPARFLVEVKSQGEPRLVRVAVAQFKEYLKDLKNSYGVLVAPYLSDTSRQICRDAGIGCIDLAGNAYLSFKNIFIDKRGKPNPFPVARVSRSVFSPKSSRLLRVLLAAPSKRWNVENMSREAGISMGLTSRVKQTLLAQEWIEEVNKTFYLVKPEEMLNRWVSNYSYQKNPAFSFYSNRSEEELEAAVKKECDKRNYAYGLALFSGARKVAPFVRFMRFFSYIDGSIENLAAALQLKKVESGANVVLIQPYDKGVFYGLQNIGGINVVSDIQLYLDLKGYKGRGEDAAQAILEKRSCQ